ncbi:MAG: hypothetical protein LLF83_09485 [Methanobacterium sp.]|nr:hypothetical protein [Methanobacterium sp.]
MRKLATLFLVIIAFGMVFAGAVSAQDVETAVLDENGDPVDVACPGEEVVVTADVTTDTNIWDPDVEITVDPETGLELDDANAVMIFNGVTYVNDPADPFFYWSDTYQAWEWWIGWVSSMDDNDYAQLFVPAVVTDVGPITVDAGLWDYNPETEVWFLLEEDSYTFLSVPCPPPCPHPPCGATVPMQATGSPLAVAALGLLSIIGGAVYGKLQ